MTGQGRRTRGQKGYGREKKAGRREHDGASRRERTRVEKGREHRY